MLELAAKRGVPASRVGEVGGDGIRIACGGEILVDLPAAEAHALWSGAIPAYFAIKEG